MNIEHTIAGAAGILRLEEKPNILQTTQALSGEVQTTIAAVAGVAILAGFVYHWIKAKFTISGFVIGILSAALVGWAVFGGIGWLRDQAKGAIETAALHGDVLLAPVGALL